MTNTERYRQQHIVVADLMDQLSNNDKLRLAQAFNEGWAVGGFGVDAYRPEYVDKVLSEIQAELAEGLGAPDMTPLQALEQDFAKLPTAEKVRTPFRSGTTPRKRFTPPTTAILYNHD